MIICPVCNQKLSQSTKENGVIKYICNDENHTTVYKKLASYPQSVTISLAINNSEIEYQHDWAYANRSILNLFINNNRNEISIHHSNHQEIANYIHKILKLNLFA